MGIRLTGDILPKSTVSELDQVSSGEALIFAASAASEGWNRICGWKSFWKTFEPTPWIYELETFLRAALAWGGAVTALAYGQSLWWAQ